MDEEMTRFLYGVFGVVEANSFEKSELWSRNKDRMTWDQNLSGFIETVGFLDNRPVCISLLTAMVDNKKLLFFYPVSQVVDHKMIDEWLNRNLPQSAFQTNGYLHQVDAMNFHNIFHKR